LQLQVLLILPPVLLLLGATSLRELRSRMNSRAVFDWNDLRHLLAVAREGSTLAAAKALGLSQPTVHRRLAALEKALGCTLVERLPTGYRLTELGEELQQYAEGVEQAVTALQRHLVSFDKGMTGIIRLTCSTTIAHRLMKSRFIDLFQTQHPGLRIELLMTERFLDLSKGEADVAIRGGAPMDEKLVGRKIADVPWGIYASRSYVERCGSPKRPEEITDHSVIEFIGEIADMRAARWLRSKAPGATVAGQSSNVPSVLLAVKSGAGLAPLPAPLADRDDELVCVLGPIPDFAYPVYLLTHRDLRKMPRISAFFDFCVRELRPILTGIDPRKKA
jgi:DNA-binding transcriptional LysR family regulator